MPNVTNGAESDPLRSAVDAAAAYLRDIDAQRWDSAAQSVDPDAAMRFRETALKLLVGWAATRAVHPDGPVGFGIALGGAVNTAMLEQFGSTPLRGIRGVATLGQLAALTPAQFVARSLERHNKEATPVSGDEPAREILAAIADGALEAQVLYRAYRSNATGVERLSMTLRDGRWFVDLQRDHRAVASILMVNMHEARSDGDAGPVA